MKRLMREHKQMRDKPVREYVAYPLEDNLLEWHFTMRGPEDTPYAGGFYHGRVLVPSNYPFAPPDVVLLTPNGRFELDKRICLSISSYHPEHWQSTWGIATVLHALREFMPTPGNNGIGAIEYPADVRKRLASDSLNFECPVCKQKVKEHIEKLNAAPGREDEASRAVPPTPPVTPMNSGVSPQGTAGSPMPPPSPLMQGSPDPTGKVGLLPSPLTGPAPTGRAVSPTPDAPGAAASPEAVPATSEGSLGMGAPATSLYSMGGPSASAVSATGGDTVGGDSPKAAAAEPSPAGPAASEGAAAKPAATPAAPSPSAASEPSPANETATAATAPAAQAPPAAQPAAPAPVAAPAAEPVLAAEPAPAAAPAAAARPQIRLDANRAQVDVTISVGHIDAALAVLAVVVLALLSKKAVFDVPRAPAESLAGIVFRWVAGCFGVTISDEL